MVVAEHPAESVAASNVAVGIGSQSPRGDQLIVDALVVALEMVVRCELCHDLPKVAFAEDHEVVQALASDRADESLSEGIQVN